MVHILSLPGCKYLVNRKPVTAYADVIKSDTPLSIEETTALQDFMKASMKLRIRSTVRTV